MSDVKVSVIVPVYNASSYLRRCLESLKSQSLADIEFIVVDDGSSDDSYEIAKEYARSDKRFIVYRQPAERLGQYQAVNDAINIAKGEYIAECDSDDWVEPDIYFEMWSKSNNADVVYCGIVEEYISHKMFYRVSADKETFYPDELGEKQKFELMNQLMFIPNGIYKREFIIKNGLFYREGKNFDDVSLSVRIRFTANTITKIFQCMYHYNKANFKSGSFTDYNTLGLVEQWRYIEKLNEEKGWKLDKQIVAQRFYSYWWQATRLKAYCPEAYWDFVFNEFQKACSYPVPEYLFSERDRKLYCEIGGLDN